MGLERISELLRRVLMIAAGVSLLALTLLATMNVALRVFQVPVAGRTRSSPSSGRSSRPARSAIPRNGRTTSSWTSSRKRSRRRSSGFSTG